MASNPTFTPRGGKTTQADIDAGRHDAANGEAGINYYHVGGNILMAAKKKYPQFRSLTEEQFKEQLRALNPHLTDKEGRKCTDKTKFTDLMIPRDKPLVLPMGMDLKPNEVQFYYECPPKPEPSSTAAVTLPGARIVPPTQDETPDPFTAPRKITPLEEKKIIDLTSRAKLPVFPSMGTVGNSAVHSVAAASFLATKKIPDVPEIQAGGRNPNTTGIQTAGDALNIALDIPLQAFPVGKYLVVPFHSSTVDQAGRVQVSNPGNNNLHGNVQAAPDKTFVVHNQWPFNGQINPLQSGDDQFRTATLLSGVGTIVDKEGNIQHAPNTLYANNQFYSANGGVPSATLSQTRVDNNFKPGIENGNKFSWGTPSGAIGLFGLSNYAKAAEMDAEVIQPQIKEAKAAFDAAPTRESAQKMIDLINYRSTLVGISNYTVGVDISKVTPQTVKDLNPAEVLAYQRAEVIKAATAKNITGLNPTNLPADAPIRSISKEDMREKMVAAFDKIAEIYPGQFERLYEEKEHVGKKNELDLKNPESRRKAVETFVESTEFYKQYQAGAVLKEVDRLISTRDPRDPTNLSKNNFSDIELGKMDARIPATKEAADGATQMIGGSPKLTEILLERAGTNRKLAEAFAHRDRLSIDLPAEFDEHKVKFRRTTEEVKARGYSQEVMDTAFTIGQGQGITRGVFDKIQSDLAASAKDPKAVQLRQRDFTTLATEGSDKIKAFPVGSLQTQLLASLTADDLKALEKGIKDENQGAPSRAEAEIEVLRAAHQYARNTNSVRDIGISHDDLRVYSAGQSVVSAAQAGVFQQAGTVAKTEEVVSFDPERATAVMKHIAKQRVSSKALLAAKAEAGVEKTSEEILDIAAKLPDAERIDVAKAALGGLSGLKGAARAQAVSELSGPDSARFLKIDAAKMSANDATFVLGALKSGNNEKLALGAIAKDGKASQAVVGLIAQDNPQFIATITKQLGGAEAVNTVAEKAGMKTEDLVSLTQSKVTTHTTTVTRSAKVEPFVAAATVGAAGSTERAVSVTKEFYTNPSTTTKAMQLLATKEPDYMAALVKQTLTAHPELLKPTADALRTQGNPGFFAKAFNQYPQGQLASILEGFATADAAKMNELTAKLNAFAANPANAQAMQDLVGSTLAAKGGTTTGREAVLGTLTNALTSTAANPLPSHSFGPQETVAALYNTAVLGDPANAAALAKAGAAVLDHLSTVPGFVIPGLIIKIKGDPKKEQKDPGPKNDIEVKPECKADCLPVDPIVEGPKPPLPAPTPPAPPPAPPLPVDPRPVPVAPAPTAPRLRVDPLAGVKTGAASTDARTAVAGVTLPAGVTSGEAAQAVPTVEQVVASLNPDVRIAQGAAPALPKVAGDRQIT